MGCGCKKTTTTVMPPTKVEVAPKTSSVKPTVTVKKA